MDAGAREAGGAEEGLEGRQMGFDHILGRLGPGETLGHQLAAQVAMAVRAEDAPVHQDGVGGIRASLDQVSDRAIADLDGEELVAIQHHAPCAVVISRGAGGTPIGPHLVRALVMAVVEIFDHAQTVERAERLNRRVGAVVLIDLDAVEPAKTVVRDPLKNVGTFILDGRHQQTGGLCHICSASIPLFRGCFVKG